MSQAGHTYHGADGSVIPNLGRTSVAFTGSSGHQSGLHFHVAQITQPLVSVAQLVDAGNVVAFDDKGGWIHHLKSGRRIRLPRVGNAFVLDMKVATEPEEEKGAAASFRRPE